MAIRVFSDLLGIRYFLWVQEYESSSNHFEIEKHSKVSLRNGSNDGKGRSTVELIMEDVINENIPLTLSIQDGDPTMNGTSHKTLWNFTIVPPNTP